MSGSVRLYQTIEVVLAPQTERVVTVSGTALRCLESNVDNFSIAIEDAPLGVFDQQVGYEGDLTFKSFRVFNGSQTATMTAIFAVAYGRVTDNRARLSGAVKISGGGTGFTYDGAVAVTDAATLVMAENAARGGAVIQAGSEDLWLGQDNTVTATGLPTIPAGGSLEISHNADVYGIRGAGLSANCGVYEETV